MTKRNILKLVKDKRLQFNRELLQKKLSAAIAESELIGCQRKLWLQIMINL